MAHNTARVISCLWGIGLADTPVGRVFEGTCTLPQNLVNSRAVGGQEENLYGMVEPRINGLSFEVQSGELLSNAVRGAGVLPTLKFLCSTDDGGFLYEGAHINDMHVRFSGAGTLIATLSIMATTVTRVSAATPAALTGPVYQWHDGRMLIGGQCHEVVEGVLSFSNNLEFLVHWDGPADEDAARLPQAIKTATYESVACRFTTRQPQAQLNGLANAPGTVGAQIRAQRGTSYVDFSLGGLSLAEEELLAIPGGGDEIAHYHIPLHGVHGSLVVSGVDG